jgi:[glutamine synthetase] adenylyltransferase / [glutamine synthetase]-adenylyl-L-tyrosine phosphorylase
MAGQLAAMGFADTSRAQRLLTDDLQLASTAEDADLLDALAGAADPDLALASLARLAGDAALRAALRTDPGVRERLVSVLGASAALGDHLARHPGDWRALSGPDALRPPGRDDLRAAMLTAVGARPADLEPAADPGRTGGQDPATALRAAYRRRLLHLAARDLTGADALDDVMAELADLATAALEAALAIARSGLPPGAAPCRLAVIAMGKCGARELNYASDVDVIFVAEPIGSDGAGGAGGASAEAAALLTATRLASGMIRACSQSTTEGILFPVDPNLRPEGRSGPLVRTLASHRAYYQRWAKTWEFQALLKARPVAGDMDLGAAYVGALAPMVWQAAHREDFVADVQAMRRRVVGSLPPGEAGREIKLGPGGLRDIEFAIQLLQLVHGRADGLLRVPATLDALAALAAGGYVGRRDAAGLAAAYRFLRAVEHLLQLRQLRRTHTLPEDPAVLRQVGRALRAMRLEPAGGGTLDRRPGGTAEQRDPPRSDPAAELIERWRQHAAQARLLHEKLFYRPLLDAVARLPGEAARLTPEAARERLEALGYVDPAGALRHIEALTAGVSRKAAIQRTLLPVLLGWFADAPEPDAGLLAFRQVSEALGGSPWYLRLLRDDMTVAQRMARLLASSRFATGLLLRAPEAVAMLGDDAQLAPRSAAALRDEAAATVRRHVGGHGPAGLPEAGGQRGAPGQREAAGRRGAPGQREAAGTSDVAGAVRALRRRELLRTAAADLLGIIGVRQTGEALSAVAAVTVSAALAAAVRKAERETGPLPTRICVVAMGRFGGHEMGYASDADVLFVHDPVPGADEEAATRAAQAVALELRGMLAQPGPDPALLIDADLRPEGRQGPLVRTLASYRAYYRRWSLPWEAQALLRAEPVAGDAALGEAFTKLADQLRYPDGGIGEPAVIQIRRIKARMEAERMPRGIDPALHLKLGPGGLADVEWVVQLIQLRHAHSVPGLRTTRTLGALDAAAQAALITGPDARDLTAAWLLAVRIRNAVMLVRGRPAETVPSSQSELAGVARLLGYPPDASQDLVQDYRRAARRSRAIMDRLFYG